MSFKLCPTLKSAHAAGVKLAAARGLWTEHFGRGDIMADELQPRTVSAMKTFAGACAEARPAAAAAQSSDKDAASVAGDVAPSGDEGEGDEDS